MTSKNLFGQSYELVAVAVKDVYPSGLEIDPKAQRELKKARVNAIAKYVIAGLDGQSVGAFFGPIVVSRRKNGKLHIMDGQHRYFGIMRSVEMLEDKIEKYRVRMSKEQLKGVTQETQEMQIRELNALQNRLEAVLSSDLPMMVYNLSAPVKERQVFHDLNLLMKRVSPSLALSYDSSNPYVVCAKNVLELPELVEFKNLVDFGVAGRSKVAEGKLFLFSTVKHAVVYMLGKRWFESGDFKLEKQTAEFTVISVFKIILNALPEGEAKFDPTFMYGHASWLQGIAAYVNLCSRTPNVDAYLTLERAMKGFDWRYTNDLFQGVGGGVSDEKGNVIFSGTSVGIRIVRNTLRDVSVVLDENGEKVIGAHETMKKMTRRAQMGDLEDIEEVSDADVRV